MIGIVIAFCAVLTFVTSNVLFRKTEHQVSSTFINFFRTAVGTITFIIIALIFNVFHMIFLLSWNIWLLLILSFIFGQVIGDTAYFRAQKDLGTTIALAISMTFPLFTFILSYIFLDRTFNFFMILSLILIGFGITIIGRYKISTNNQNRILNNSNNPLENKNHEIFKKTTVKAMSFSLIASLGWAIGAIIIEFATNQINEILQIEEQSSIVGNVIRFPFALFILLSMVLRERYLMREKENSIYKKKSTETWILLVVASIIGTSIGAYLYTEAIRLTGSNFVSLLATASPLFSLPLTYLINKEKITKLGFLGVALTIVGVVFILI